MADDEYAPRHVAEKLQLFYTAGNRLSNVYVMMRELEALVSVWTEVADGQMMVARRRMHPIVCV